MIRITDNISISENEIKEEFIRSSGPGGQNVNKVSTAVQLRFDIYNSESLPNDVKKRLAKLAGNRVTDDGILIIDSRKYRSQIKNREESLKRLIDLIKNAVKKPKKRFVTGVPKKEKEKRLKEKKQRSKLKQLRQNIDLDEN